MSRHKVTVILMRDDEEGGYVAFMPLFPDCTTQGETEEEALANAKESLELLFEDPSPDDLEDLKIAHSSEVISTEVVVELPVHPRVSV